MSERWFPPGTLHALAQPSTERIIGLLEAGRREEALETLRTLPQEWAFLHKLMAESVAATVDYVREQGGDNMAADAVDFVTRKAWRDAFVDIADDRRARVAAMLDTRWQEEGPSGLTLQDIDAEAWPDKATLRALTRPRSGETAVACLESGDYAGAIEACLDFQHEWGLLHDLLVESVVALLTFIGERMGEDAVGPALDAMTERAWTEPFHKIEKLDRRSLLQALAATWRAHSTEGVGPDAGRFRIEEDEEKFTFVLDPAGSGGRLYRRGMYEPPKSYAKTRRAHPWSFNREGLPYYCAHCTFMNEILPIRESGAPLYPLDPPESPEDVCRWYLYKDPRRIPARFYERYGFDRDAELARYRERHDEDDD
ncbi:MAG TPA: hypothetical protein VFA86_07035 [Gammaproteobacteria bacterium]|nr:hypothetical protein [Gammaproteobacteria bacterium]